MKKNNIACYISLNRQKKDGITHFISEIFANLEKSEDMNYFFNAYLSLRDKKSVALKDFQKIVPQREVRVKKTIFINKLKRHICEFWLPYIYRRFMNNGADAHVFFNNYVPFCKFKGKVAVIIHDLTPIYSSGGKSLLSKCKRIRNFLRYKHTVKVADLIFTVSEFSANDIIKHFPQAEGKIVVNYCGMDYERFSKPVPEELKRAIRAEYKLPDKYFLFVGQARENKNLKNTIKGYSLLPEETRKEYKLVLANHTQDLVSLAENLGVKDDIKFLSGIKEEHLVGVFQMAFAELLISFSEGFGLPMVEAMAAGVPSITSNCSCLPEVAGGAALLVDPYDAEEIKNGMQRLIEDGNLRQELIEKGKIRAKDFSWSNTAQVFETKLRELCR